MKYPIVSTLKNYKSIERALLGERVRRTQQGFPPQDGRCDKVNGSFLFIPDGEFGFRNRTPLISSFGDTFEIIPSSPAETPVIQASTNEFITLLYGYMLPKYPGLAELLNGNPEPWIIAIARVREICNARGITDDFDQLPYVVANVFPVE